MNTKQRVFLPGEWHKILTSCGVKEETSLMWSDVFSDVIRVGTFSLGTSEIDDFLGQILHESAMLERLTENLNYSAERICHVWPSRFKNIEDARPFEKNPVALANRVYGNRMGNTRPNDGWRYKGRGLIQITGRDNYAFVSDLIGQDLVLVPEMLEHPRCALQASIAWWENRIPDSIMGDNAKITKRVNGGTHGINHRAKLQKAAEVEIKNLEA